jgi:hypothetical protein
MRFTAGVLIMPVLMETSSQLSRKWPKSLINSWTLLLAELLVRLWWHLAQSPHANKRPCIPSSTPPCFTAPASPMREPCPEAMPCPSGTCRYVLQHLARLLVDHRRPSKCFSTAYWTPKQFWNGSTCTRRSRNHG